MLVSSNKFIAFFGWVVSGFGYSFFSGNWLHFSFLFNNKNPGKYISIIKFCVNIPIVLFIVRIIMVDPSQVMVRTYYGWIDICQQTLYYNIYNISITSIYIAGIIIIFLNGRQSKNNRIKKQAKIILISSIISFSIGLITDIILPIMGIIIYPIGIITELGIIGGICYTISKYKMMSITPKFISEYIFNTVNEPIFILDDKFVIENCNAASLNIINYKYDELNGKIFNTLINKKNFDLKDLMKDGYIKNVEVELQKKNGENLVCELSGTVILDEYNDTLGIAILLYDISERKRLEEVEKKCMIKLENTNTMLINQIEDRIRIEKQISHSVYYDALTELPNRKKMLESINILIKNKDKAFAVLFIDLDGFKSINDNFGHQVGDMVLKDVSNRIKNILGINDTISRIGGDEFIILLGKLMVKSYVEEVAEKIKETLKKPIMHDGNNLFVGASIGVSIFPEHGINSDTLIKNADLAMYEVKGNGGYGHIIYSPKMNDKVIDKLKMKVKLNEALKNNEFVTYYQPIMDLKAMEILNTEGLIRWKQDDKIIQPIEFIPVARSVGEIVAIDNWMLESACIQCKRCHELGAEDFCVSVNVSYTQLKQPNFVVFVKSMLEAYSLLPKYLNLEITEDEAMEDPEVIISILTELRNIGVKISLDDFGTGYSSFSYINKLPIDKIKIDRSLITNLQNDYKNIMIIKSIIRMAHSLNIRIVAEGIETKEQFNILKNLKCDFVQGYLIGKPMEAHQFEKNFINAENLVLI